MTEVPFSFSCYNHSDRRKIVHKLFDGPSFGWKVAWLQTKNCACILKAHSHSKSGCSIWASLECWCCFWIAGALVSYLTTVTKSSLTLTLNEWRFNMSFSWVSMLFLNSWRVSSHIVRYDTKPPAVQKQQWHSREAQIEPPLIECQCEWAFRIRALESHQVWC
jgi:hypothetical protein